MNVVRVCRGEEQKDVSYTGKGKKNAGTPEGLCNTELEQWEAKEEATFPRKKRNKRCGSQGPKKKGVRPPARRGRGGPLEPPVQGKGGISIQEFHRKRDI